MLDIIKNNISNLFTNKKALLILVISLIFLALAIYVYITYVTPKLKPQYAENKEFIQKTETSEAELYFFFTEWCPHCKKAKPEWQKLKDEFADKKVNNTTVYFREIDCDKNEEVADKFKVDGYPTIKLVKEGQIIEYDAKPNYDTMVEFLHTTL